MLQQHPKSAKYFESTNSYRYVNNQLVSYGPLYKYSKESAGTWAVLRYLLESNNGTCFNNYTYLTAYSLDGKKLHAEDPLPDLVHIRRHPMPRGFRQYLPPDLNRRFMIAEAELNTCRKIMDEASRNFLVDSDNYEHHNAIYKETLARSKRLSETLQDIREKCGFHASDLKHELRTTEPHEGVIVTQVHTFPPSNYVCSICQCRGIHFKDNCDTDLTKRSTELVWGAAKMKRL